MYGLCILMVYFLMKSKIKNNKPILYFKSLYKKFKSFFLSKISFLVKKIYSLNINLNTKTKKLESIEKGYIYMAFGENFYLECINSVKILKLTTKLPIHLFTDKKNIPKKDKKLFFSISHLPNLHLRSKVDYISLSPFNKTIYLDTDIIVVKKIDNLFNLLDKFDILATLDTARKRENMSRKIKEYEKIPYAFGEVNSGLLCFNRFAREKILKKWPNIFYRYMKESGGWDQPSLRILLWKLNASLYILPPEFNIRSKKLLEKVQNNKKILGDYHMSPRIYHMHLYDDIYKSKIKKLLSKDELIKLAKEKAYKIIY